MTQPILTYEIQTNPNPVEVSAKATITLLVSNGSPNFVYLSEIQVKMPPKGKKASDFTNDMTNIGTKMSQPGWTIEQDKSTFKITPNKASDGSIKPVKIGGQALMFTFGPFNINDVPGTATVSVAEDTGTAMSDAVEFKVSKWPPSFKISNFHSTHASIRPGDAAQLLWDMQGNATLKMEYQGLTVPNPPNPFTSKSLGQTTTFSLTASSEINGEPVYAHLQYTVEVAVPAVLSSFPTYDIVYDGQGNSLHWTTQQTDHCVLKANGVVVDDDAPANTKPEGYPIAPSAMKPSTTFELDPVKGSTTGQRKNFPAFAKSLTLKATNRIQKGWGYLTLDRQGTTAYICNSATHALDVVALKTPDKQIQSIPVGLGPRGVSLSADGKTAYVSNAFDDTVSIVDLETHRVNGTLPVASPAGSTVLGNTLFVASLDASAPKIVTVNLETGAVSGDISVSGRPYDVAITQDGQTIYVANNAGTSIDIYDVGTGSKSGSVDVKEAPTTVTASGNGAGIYAGSRLGKDIAVIDAHCDTPNVTAQVPAYMNPAALGVSGNGQFVAAVGPTGFFVFELELPTATARTMVSLEVPDTAAQP